MKTSCLLYILFIQFMIISCSNKAVDPENKKAYFKQITYSTGLCYGTCPETAGYIDDSLNFYFFGGKYAEKDSLLVGYYKGVVSDTIWLETNNKAILLKKYFDSSWEINPDGSAIQINFIDSTNRNIKISGDDMMSDSIYFFVKWLQKLSKRLTLKEITYSSFFEKTGIQKSNLRLPPPPLKAPVFSHPQTRKL